MAKREKRRPWIRWFLLALAFLSLYFFFMGHPSLFKLARLQRELRAEQNVDSLTAREQELEAQKKRLLTDSTYLEKLARQETGMARPKEKVYHFVSNSGKGDSTPGENRR